MMLLQFRTRHLILLGIFQLAVFEKVFSFGDHNGRGTKAVSLANSFVAMADNPWSIAYNAAGLAQVKSVEISTFFVPEQFGLQELKTVSVAAAFPLEFIVAGLELDQFGFELYKESSLRFGVGISIDPGLMGGATVNLERVSIERYGSTQTTTIDVGLLAKIQNDLRLGFSFHNVLGSTIGPSNERLPQIFLLGARYAFLSDLVLVAEVEKDIRYSPIIKGGMEKSIFDFLSIRIGVSNNPDKFSAGIGLRYANVDFGYAGYSHNDLSWTHQVEIGFVFGEE